jgi:hypothetical protein
MGFRPPRAAPSRGVTSRSPQSVFRGSHPMHIQRSSLDETSDETTKTGAVSAVTSTFAVGRLGLEPRTSGLTGTREPSAPSRRAR